MIQWIFYFFPALHSFGTRKVTTGDNPLIQTTSVFQRKRWRLRSVGYPYTGVSSHPSLSARLNKKMIKTSWNRMDWTLQSNEAWVLQSVMQPCCSYSDLSSRDCLSEGVLTLCTSQHLIKESLGFSLLNVFCLSCFGLHSSQWYFHANISSCKYILFVLERKTPGICDQMLPGSKNRFYIEIWIYRKRAIESTPCNWSIEVFHNIQKWGKIFFLCL